MGPSHLAVTMKAFLGEFLWIAIPKGVAGVGAILINVVLIRHLETEAFGAYSLCLAGVLLADGVIGSAFDVAVLKLATVTRATSVKHSYNLESAALVTKLVLGLLASAVVLLCSRPLSRAFFHAADARELIALSCLAALGLLAMRSIQAHLQVDHRFKMYGGLDLAHSCLRFGGIGAILVWIPQNPQAIMWVVATAPLAIFLVGIGTVGRHLAVPSAGIQEAVHELGDFVRWSLLTTGIATLGRQVDVFLMSHRANLSEVGIYSGGQAFAVIPLMFGMYVSIVVGPRIMRNLQAGTFWLFYRRIQRALLMVALVLLVAGLLMVDYLRQYVLPAQYDRSAIVLAILWPGALAGTVSFPLVITFLMFVRPSFLFKLELIILPTSIVAYVFAIDRYGAVGAAWVTSLCCLVKAGIAGVYASQLARHAQGSLAAEPAITQAVA